MNTNKREADCPRALRSKVPHNHTKCFKVWGIRKVGKESFSKADFQTLKIFCSLRLHVASSFSFGPRPLNFLGGHALGGGGKTGGS